MAIHKLHKPAGRQLQEIEKDCEEPNWDGYHAEPVGSLAILFSTQILMQLKSIWETPDISPEASDGVGFEWENGSKSLIFVVHSNSDFVFVFDSGIRGVEAFKGTVEFNGVLPPEICNLVDAHFRRKKVEI